MKTFRELNFPATRIATLDVGQVSKRRHHVAALLELDVTAGRQKIKEVRRRTGEYISFSGWITSVFAEALQDFPAAHAFLKSKRRALAFDDVDISMTVERPVEGELVPLPMVLRAANRKSVTDISREIREAKANPLDDKDVIVGQQGNRFLFRLYYFLPGFMRRNIWRFIRRQPKPANRLMGSAIVTNISMMGRVRGWFIHASFHPVSFGISSVVKKPAVVKNQIEIRDMLHLTVLLDHDVIDGAPMARFLQRLSELAEKGYGL